jgi:hypothetical protein
LFVIGRSFSFFVFLFLASACGNEEEFQDGNTPPVYQSPLAISTVENSQSVYQAAASDSDGDPISFRISGGMDGDQFRIGAASGLLVFARPPNFEQPEDADTDNIYEVDITVSDDNGGSKGVSLLVTVIDLPEAPVINAPAVLEVEESERLAYELAAYDPDGGELSFSLEGGADDEVFMLDAVSGVLRPEISLDFEQPGDENRDSRYEVLVGATDEDGDLSTHALRIHVTEVNEPPVLSVAGSLTTSENRLAVTTVTASDPEQESLTFQVSGGADASLFDINADNGALVFVEPPDFEMPSDTNGDNTYELIIGVTDYRGLSDTRPVLVHVTDRVRDIQSRLEFPAQGSRLAARAETTPLVGRLYDLEGGSIAASDISYIDVAGQSIAIDASDPSHWQALLDMAGGNQTVIVEVGLANGDVQTSSHQLDNQPFFTGSSLTVDAAANRVIVPGVDGGPELVAVNLASGETTPAGRCPAMGRIAALELRDSGNEVLAAAADATGEVGFWNIGIDSQTCVRVPDAAVGEPGLGEVEALLLEEEPVTGGGPRAISLDGTADALVVTDLASGARNTLSGSGSGAGPAFGALSGAVRDRLDPRAFVAAPQPSGRLYGVTLDGGARQVLVEGLDMAASTPLALDTLNDRVFFATSTGDVHAVSPVDGTESPVIPAGAPPGPLYMRSVLDMALDASSGRLVVSADDAEGHDRLLIAPVWTGTKSVLANNRASSGPSFRTISDMVLLPDIGAGLVVDQGAGGAGLVRISLSNGVRTRLNTSLLSEARALIHDADNGRALVLGVEAISDDYVIAATDTSGNEIGRLTTFDGATGPAPVIPADMALDTVRDRLLVVDSGLDSVLAVDSESGEHSVVSDNAVGLGPAMNQPTSLLFDANNDRILIVDGVLGLMAIDPQTGDRTDLVPALPDGSHPDAEADDVALGVDGDLLISLEGKIQRLNEVADTFEDVAQLHASPGRDMDSIVALSVDARSGLIWAAGSSGRVLVIEPGSGVYAVSSR